MLATFLSWSTLPYGTGRFKRTSNRTAHIYQESGEDPGRAEGRGCGLMEGGPLDIPEKVALRFSVNRARARLSQPRLKHSVRPALGDT